GAVTWRIGSLPANSKRAGVEIAGIGLKTPAARGPVRGEAGPTLTWRACVRPPFARRRGTRHLAARVRPHGEASEKGRDGLEHRSFSIAVRSMAAVLQKHARHSARTHSALDARELGNGPILIPETLDEQRRYPHPWQH